MFGWNLPWLQKKATSPPVLEPESPNFIMNRYEGTDHGTFSIFTGVECSFRCHIIELPWRGNRVNYSCIPTGVYKVEPYTSQRFGRCFRVMNVEGRTAILLHPANLAGDREKGFSSQLRGCLAPGRLRCRLTGKTGKKQRAVGASRPALGDLLRIWGHRPFTLKITGEH